MHEKEFEYLTIEAIINKHKTVFSNIYRSPSPLPNVSTADHIDNFINYLDTHLHNLSLYNCDSYVFLDSNINLLTINNNDAAARYLERIYSNGFLQKVGKATRVNNNSFSLIDHILYKNNVESNVSGTIVSDISDHFPNFIGIPNIAVKQKIEPKFSRNFTLNNMEKFNDDLGKLQWGNVLACEEVNESFYLFWHDFMTLFNLRFPLKKVKFNKNVHKIQNFMTT